MIYIVLPNIFILLLWLVLWKTATLHQSNALHIILFPVLKTRHHFLKKQILLIIKIVGSWMAIAACTFPFLFSQFLQPHGNFDCLLNTFGLTSAFAMSFAICFFLVQSSFERIIFSKFIRSSTIFRMSQLSQSLLIFALLIWLTPLLIELMQYLGFVDITPRQFEGFSVLNSTLAILLILVSFVIVVEFHPREACRKRGLIQEYNSVTSNDFQLEKCESLSISELCKVLDAALIAADLERAQAISLKLMEKLPNVEGGSSRSNRPPFY